MKLHHTFSLVIGALLMTACDNEPNPYEDLTLADSAGYYEITEAIPEDEIKCIEKITLYDNRTEVIECQITDKLDKLESGKVVQTSAGPIRINYLLTDGEGMNLYSEKGQWACIGATNVDFLREDGVKTPYLYIPNCKPLECDPDWLVKTSERTLVKHCLNLRANLSEIYKVQNSEWVEVAPTIFE